MSQNDDSPGGNRGELDAVFGTAVAVSPILMEHSHESTERLLQRCAVAMRKAKRLTRSLAIELERNMGFEDQAIQRVPADSQAQKQGKRSFV